MSKYKVDINRILIRPLYYGLLMNVFVPVLVLGAVYYFDHSGAADTLQPGGDLNYMFWGLLAVAIADGVIAIAFKQKRFFMPMIRSQETFAEDLAKGVFSESLICYALSGAIAIYGLVFYLMGGNFLSLFLFVFISFIAFQFVRPRYGFLEKVLAAQEKMADEGRFLQSRN